MKDMDSSLKQTPLTVISNNIFFRLLGDKTVNQTPRGVTSFWN